MPLDQTTWKPETETKPDVFSLEGLIAWLELQPKTKWYDYCNSSACLWANYLKSQGVKKYDLYSYELPGGTDGWGHQIAGCGAHTYGAALSRARALLASRPKE